MLPDDIVHGYFWLTISVYLVGLVIVFSLSRTVRTPSDPARGALQDATQN